jgi:hypothetical protein
MLADILASIHVLAEIIDTAAGLLITRELIAGNMETAIPKSAIPAANVASSRFARRFIRAKSRSDFVTMLYTK